MKSRITKQTIQGAGNEKHYSFFKRPEMAILAGHDFPLAILRMSGEKTLGPMHGHSFHELVIIVSGSGTYHNGEVERHLKSGDVFLVCPGDSHLYVSENNLSLINVVWDSEALPLQHLDQESYRNFERIFHHSVPNKHQVNLPVQQLVEVVKLTNDIASELKGGHDGFMQAAAAHLLLLFALLLRSFHKAPGQNLEYRRMLIGKAINYLEAHYAEEVSREEVAAMLHLSGPTFYRYFLEVTGQSFREYLIGLRMAHGENLLRNTSLPIADIAERIGFTDSNYFITQFKRYFGVPPRKYRYNFLK